MASNTTSQNLPNQPKRTSFSSFASNNASIFLDRTKVGIRGSTPDSEALASSDDEHDQLYRLQTVTSNPAPKSGRRASWFNENQQPSTRKPSFGGNGPFSPVSPGTVSSTVDQAPWNTATASTAGPGLGRGHSSNSSFTWGNTIWNSDGQKGPPQRLSEVLPSPTTTIPPGSAGFYQEDNPLRSPPLTRDQGADPSIPFSIPLQPTLKSYRSQSYSVGQIEPETATNQSNAYGGASAFTASRRGASYAGVHHRPSRPSMLGDTTHDPNPLGQLREVEDDEEVSGSSSSGAHGYHDGSRTIEDLAGENAMLRQQLAANQFQNARSTHATSSTQRPKTSGQYYHQRLHGSGPEDPASPLYDPNDGEYAETNRPGGVVGRRFSEYSTRSGPHYTLGVNADPKAPDHARRGQWQSSLGFARVEEPPKSRRHSFAEMPTRHNSLSSVGDDELQHSVGDFAVSGQRLPEDLGAFGDRTSRPAQGDNSKFAISSYPLSKTEKEMHLVASHSHDRDFAVKYFSQPNPSPRLAGDLQALSSSSLHQAYAQSQPYRSQPLGHTPNRSNQLLYIVTFKCLRADVFYIQEGTGLRVKKGDLVIVEADRGTDLGTVQSEDIPWAEAKQLKEDYTKRHHEWLMAFSHHTQNGTIAGPNPNGPSLGQSTLGLSSSAGFQDLPSGEIKPKMIKRLAQPHEISTLREKEGSEAKAKRMCQQKVVDHRLSMEILDAEFQMDWKKLTFFYFADSYINFNPLVTDLFKIYKTRIWMSAINTAAIATPHAGIRPPGLSRNMVGHDYEEYRPSQYPQAAVTTSSHGATAAFNGMIIPGVAYDHIYPQGLQGHGLDSRQMSPYPTDYRQQGHQPMALPPQFGHLGYATPNLHHTSSFSSQPDSNNAGHHNRHIRTEDWTQGFQDLSIDQ